MMMRSQGRSSPGRSRRWSPPAAAKRARRRLVAENLVTANLTGHDSHGIGMIPRYIDALLEGGLAANQHPKLMFDGGAMLALDGAAGYGQMIGCEAMEIGDRAREEARLVRHGPRPTRTTSAASASGRSRRWRRAWSRSISST